MHFQYIFAIDTETLNLIGEKLSIISVMIFDYMTTAKVSNTKTISEELHEIIILLRVM